MTWIKNLSQHDTTLEALEALQEELVNEFMRDVNKRKFPKQIIEREDAMFAEAFDAMLTASAEMERR